MSPSSASSHITPPSRNSNGTRPCVTSHYTREYREIQTELGSLICLFQAQDVSLYNAAKVKCLKLSLVSHNATIEKFKWSVTIKQKKKMFLYTTPPSQNSNVTKLSLVSCNATIEKFKWNAAMHIHARSLP
jgi:hypothetical protein